MIDFQLLTQELGPDPAIAAQHETTVAETREHYEPMGDEEPSVWQDEGDRGLIKVKELPPIVDSFDFVAQVFEPSPELIAGILHQGTKMVVGGGSKSFKTWIQSDIAVSVAYGLPWMEFPTIAGRVLFVNMEIKPEFFQHRVTKICESRGIQQCKDRLDIWNLRGFIASYRILIPKIIERIRQTGYRLIILDPIYKLYGNTDENSASEVAQLLNELENVCVETGAAIIFGAHYSKGNQAGKESIDRISGSGVFARDPDSILPFTKHQEEGSFVVEPILRNLPPVKPFVVTWNYPLMERDNRLDPAELKQSGPGRNKKYVATDFLRLIDGRNRENPISVSDWAELAGVPRRTLTDYLPELRTSGYIITIGEGRLARQSITDKGREFVAMANGGN